MKKYSSWGEFVTVETTDKIYKNVILCPNPSNEDEHLLEYYNGDTVTIKTKDIKRINDYVITQ
jgi:hypothetical protein